MDTSKRRHRSTRAWKGQECKSSLVVIVPIPLPPRSRLCGPTPDTVPIPSLGLDYVDLYLMHSAMGGQTVDTWTAMVELKREGFIRCAVSWSRLGVGCGNVSCK